MMTSSVKRAKVSASADTEVSGSSSRKRVQFHLLQVSQMDLLTDDAVAITFAVPDSLREEFIYRAGQHLAVRSTIAGDNVRRNYSICAPEDSQVLRIGVKRLPDGVFSNYAMERLRAGDTLEVLTPSGSFTTNVDPGQAKHYGAIAAGSGITPILSIISTILSAEPGSRVTLIFVNVSTNSIMFLEEIEDLKNIYLDRLSIFHVLDGERQGAEVLSGRLDSARLTALLDGAEGDSVDDWFLCGPLPMTDMIRETLKGRGFDDEHIHRELFHVGATPPPKKTKSSSGKGSAITAHLEGRSTDLTLEPGTDTLLDAIRTVRAEVPFACTNGVCGTCRCRLVAGTVEMVRNFALEEDEVANGYILSCQSYPTSEEVIVDFDQ